MNCILKFVITLIVLPPCINGQQNYSGGPVFRCNRTIPTESLFYTCNGQHSSCRAFLIFTVKSPYVTVLAIANLTSSDHAEISRINNITTFKVLPEGQEVIVPVKCSCSGENYQASTTYQILPADTYFIIANKTFQALSTCDALKHANTYPETSLLPGQKLRVPLRCACPTAKQAAAGTKFLLTYSVGHGDTLPALSKRFNVSVMSICEANSLPDEYGDIHPFTTILIPWPSEPSHLHAIRDKYNVTTSPPLPRPVVLKSRSNRILLIVGITAGAFSLLILLLLVLFFLSRKKRAQVPHSSRRNAKVSSPQDLILEIARLDRALKAYKFSEIKKATRSFGYRGTFKREVLAVKKSSGNADHEMKMLVYEYMANGSLREWLSRRGSRDIESWNQHVRIALDVANGLLYLHSFASPAYVHNDVTSSNVLLDNNLNVLMQVQLLQKSMYMPLE